MTKPFVHRRGIWGVGLLLACLALSSLYALWSAEQRDKQWQHGASEQFGHSALQFRLRPGEVREATVDLWPGQVVRYFWTTNGVRIEFEVHGPDNRRLGFANGDAASREGALKAQQAGPYHWRWRNHGPSAAIITVEATGRFRAFGCYDLENRERSPRASPDLKSASAATYYGTAVYSQRAV